MKKKLMSFVLAAAMVLSMPAALFAVEIPAEIPTPGQIENPGDTAAPASVDTYSVGTDRTSNTSGKVSAYAAFDRTATTASCTIILQEKYNGSWRTATGLSTTSYVKTVYSQNSITAGKVFTLISGKTYRAKIMFYDTNSTGSNYKTVYTGSF